VRQWLKALDGWLDAHPRTSLGIDLGLLAAAWWLAVDTMNLIAYLLAVGWTVQLARSLVANARTKFDRGQSQRGGE
jgi:hypothetical protein